MSWVASPRWNGPDGGALFLLSYSGTTAPTATVSGNFALRRGEPEHPGRHGRRAATGYPDGRRGLRTAGTVPADRRRGFTTRTVIRPIG